MKKILALVAAFACVAVVGCTDKPVVGSTTKTVTTAAK